jgi:hypothetical protein
VTALCTSGSCAVASSQAQCPAGSAVLSGGWASPSGQSLADVSVAFDAPASATSWGIILVNWANAGQFYAVATCGRSGSALAPSAAGTSAALGEQLEHARQARSAAA